MSDEDAVFDIAVTYKDGNNKEYSETISVPARYTEIQEAKSNTATIIIILVVLAAGIWYFRYKRNHKRKH